MCKMREKISSRCTKVIEIIMFDFLFYITDQGLGEKKKQEENLFTVCTVSILRSYAMHRYANILQELFRWSVLILFLLLI